MFLKLAIVRYNKQGNEGLSSYNEGGESESYLSEDEVLSGISNYRLSAMARSYKMKKRSLKKFQLKKYKPSKDDEGNVVESYEKCSHEDVALIWPASSKLQVELYGMRDKWHLEYALLWLSSNQRT